MGNWRRNRTAVSCVASRARSTSPSSPSDMRYHGSWSQRNNRAWAGRSPYRAARTVASSTVDRSRAPKDQCRRPAAGLATVSASGPLSLSIDDPSGGSFHRIGFSLRSIDILAHRPARPGSIASLFPIINCATGPVAGPWVRTFRLSVTNTGVSVTNQTPNTWNDIVRRVLVKHNVASIKGGVGRTFFTNLWRAPALYYV